MKILDKFKRGFLLLTLFLGFVLVGYGISLSVNATPSDTNSEFPTVTYSYKAYTKEAWDTYNNTKIEDCDGNQVSVADVKSLLEEYETLTPGSKKELNFFIKTNDFSCNYDETIDRGSTSAEVYATLKNEIATIENNFANGAVSKLVPGQDVIIATYAETSDGSDIWNIQVSLDIMSIIDGTPTYYTNDGIGATYTTGQTVGVSSKATCLGFAWTDPTAGSAPSPAYIGAVGFKVSPSASDITVQFAKDANTAQTLFGTTSSTDASNPTITYGKYGQNFAEIPLQLKGAAVSSNTNLETLTVDGGSNLAASDSGAGPSYAATSNITANSTTVYAAVKDSGSIANTAYVHTSAPNLASPTSGTTVSVSNGTFNVNMSSVATGSSVWVTFQAIASNNTNTKWYSIELPKAKSKDANLEGVTIGCQVSGSNVTVLSKSASDLSSTTNFDVYYPSGANNFTLTPIAATLSKTIEMSGSTVASGTAKSITVTDGGTVTVTVKAQDDTVTKTYTFTFHETSSKPDSVSGSSGQPVKVVNATYTANNTTFTMNDMAPGRDSFDLSITFPSSFPSSTATVRLIGAENNPVTLTLSNGVYKKVGISYGTGYTGDNAKLAATKTMTLEVTLSGMPAQTYTLVVNRPEVSDDENFVITNASYNNLTGGGTTTITIPTSGTTHTVNNLPYNTPKVNFTISMNNASSKTEIIAVTASDTSSGNSKINGVAQTYSLPTGPTNTTASYRFYVKTEFDALQGSNGTLHTIVFNENAADSTKTFKTVDVKGGTSGTKLTPKSTTTSGTTVTETYALDPTTDGTTFTVDMTWDDPNKTKAYIGTTPNPTTPYSSSSNGPFTVGDTIYLVLEAEDGSKITRVIKTETKKSSDNGIVSVKIEDVPTTGAASTLLDTPVSSSKLNYAYPDVAKVVYGTKKVKFTVVVSNAKSALTIGGATTPTGSTTRTVELNVNSNTNNYAVVCTAEDGTVGSTYNFTVEREQPFTDSYIESLTIGGINCMVANTTYFDQPFSKTATSFVMTLPCNFSNNSVGFTVSNRASYSVTISGSGTPITGVHPTAGAFNFGTLADNSHYSFTITVVSEKDRIDNTTTSTGTHTYNFDIYVGDKETELDSLDLVKPDNSALANTSGGYLDISNYSNYSTAGTAFEVPYDVDKVKISIGEKTGFHGTVTYNNGTNPEISLSAGSALKITVKVTSELAGLDASKFGSQVKSYVFYVKRKDCDHDQTLKSLEVKIDGVVQNINFQPNKFSYNIENLSSGSTLTFNGVPNDPSSKVLDNGDRPISGLNYSDQLNQTTETFSLHVQCKCTNKTAQAYTFTLSTKPYVKSTTPGALSFTASTVKGVVIGASTTPPFSVSTTAYTIKLSNQTSPEDNYVNFDISKAIATSSVYFNDGGADQSTKDGTVTYSTTNIPLGGTKTVKIWTLAEDGTTKGTEYVITITRDQAASTDNELASLMCNGVAVPGFSQSNSGPYDVKIGNQDYAYFTVTTSDGKASVTNPFDSYANRYTFPATEFSHTFPIVVTAEDGSTKTYTVVVTRDDKTILDNLDAKVDGTSKLAPNYSSAVLEYTVSLGLKENSVVLEYTPNNVNTKVSILNPSGAAVNYTGTSYTVSVPNPTFDAAGNDTPLVYTVVVTAASGAKTEYKVKISKERGSDDVYIQSFEYLEKTGAAMVTLGMTTGVFKYEYRVDRDITVFNPDTNGNVKITLNDPNATYTVTSSRNLTAGKKNPITIEVVPASGDTTKKKVYTFDVYPCSDEFTVDDVRALLSDQSGNLLDEDKTTYIDYKNSVLSITVPHGTASILNTYLKVTSTADNHKVFLDGSEMTNPIQNLVVGTNTFRLRVVSDYAAAYFKETGTLLSNYCSPEIVVTIVRKDLSHDATLKTLTVTYTDDQGQTQTKSFDGLPGNGLFTLPYLGDNVSNITISATPNYPYATVIGDGTKQLTDGTTDTSGNYNFTVRCTAEDGTTYLDYPIAIARGKIDLNKDNSILEITVEDSDGNVYLAGSDFDPDISDYGVFKIPFKSQGYIISVKKPDGTHSKTWIDGNNVNSLTTTITEAMRGTTKDVLVYAIAQDSTVGKGTEYKIKLEFEAASTDATLSSLKADGTTVPGFDPEVLEYTLPARPNSTEVINIEYETSDSKATVTGDTGVQQLKEGNNTFVVVVKAESGASKTYRIHVQRDYPLPYLTDLSISGEKLLDSNYKTTEFAKEEYNYTAIVSYMTLHATINATVDNKDFTVTCSNSTINTTGDFLRTFNVDLVEGLNTFAITVTSPENKTVTYNLVIKRRGEASTNTEVEFIDILQIPAFKDEYTNDERQYSYEVPNGIKSLDVKVRPAQGPTADGEGATYRIVNGRDSGQITDENVNLRVGKNTLVVLITAEDGESTRAIVVEVTRAPISFTVDTEAYDYTCTKKENGDYAYKIDLGKKRAADIEDYTKYIVFDNAEYDSTNQYVEKPEVTVLTDTANKNCNEVIVRIYDGDEEIFVTFELESEALGGSSIPEILQIIMPWILLAIAIIILIIILICVNRDKFGAINKKRKKDDEQEA